MKKFLILLVFIMVPMMGQAQIEFPKRWYMAITVGGSIPLNEFASDNIQSDGSGFAKPGFGMSFLQVAYFFHPNAGVYFDAGYSHQDMDQDLPGIVKREFWNYGSTIIGGVLSWPLKHVNFDLRAGVGAMILSSPYVNVNGAILGSDFIDSGFAFQLGGGVRVHVSDHVSLLANADYLNSSPTLKGIDFKVDHRIDVLKLTVGVGYRM